jgi:hypothetical protein
VFQVDRGGERVAVLRCDDCWRDVKRPATDEYYQQHPVCRHALAVARARLEQSSLAGLDDELAAEVDAAMDRVRESALLMDDVPRPRGIEYLQALAERVEELSAELTAERAKHGEG